MQLKTFIPLALAAFASAQSTQSLTDVLASQNATLSSLTGMPLSTRSIIPAGEILQANSV